MFKLIYYNLNVLSFKFTFILSTENIFFIVVVLVLLNDNKPALRSDLNNASECAQYIYKQILKYYA